LPELESGWQAQLRLLLEWAGNNVPYYRRSAEIQACLKVIRRQPRAFWQEWRKLPVLKKADLRRDGKILSRNSLPEHHDPIGVISTSGSTGIPVRLNNTRVIRTVQAALAVRDDLVHRRDFGKRMGNIRYLPRENRQPDGILLRHWAAHLGALYGTGPASSIHIALPLEKHIAWLRRFDPHYLLTYPSVAKALVNAIGGASEKPPALQEIRLISEQVDDQVVEAITQGWGIKCTDLYSANEVGYIATRCAEHGRLHVEAESVFVELLNDAGDWCAPGESGRVVVTPLHNLATPLVRYEIGDYAVAGEPCPCGRGGPVLDRVLGRVRNFVRTPDGQRVWPVALGRIGRVDPVVQAQYVQSSLDTIELHMVVSRPLSAEEEDQAVQIVREVLDYPFEVRLVVVDDIRRGPTGKFEEFLSLIHPD
jgi:phenylacetate-CoA ligase